MIDMQYLGEDRVQLRYKLPLAEIVFDFFDQLKSKTQGYASLDYEEKGDAEGNLVKVDILLQGEKVDAFSQIVHRDKAYAYGVTMTGKLRELIPRQQFEVPIQAAIGAKIIARENLEIPSLYFAHNREVVWRNDSWIPNSEYLILEENEKIEIKKIRFRTLGDITITGGIESEADTIQKIVAEVSVMRKTERGNRSDDKRSESSMEDRKRQGYF